MLTPSLPDEFVKAILEDSPFGVSLLTSLDSPSPTSIRINPRKGTPIGLKVTKPVPWNEHGFYLADRPSFTLDPLYHAGVYYAQEAASMVVGALIKELPLGDQAIVLDACAAPGGKTLALADGLPANTVIVANEINRHRSNILAENLSKWGLDNVIVTQNSTDAFSTMEGLFDVLLVDAPCSGEGMFRKDVKARSEWTPKAPLDCSIRQRRILTDLTACLKAGGFLIYATCTFNRQENEEQIASLLESKIFDLYPWKVPSACILGRNGLGHYFIPGITESEGLYIALLRKRGTTVHRPPALSEATKSFNLFPVHLTQNQTLYEDFRGVHRVSKTLNTFLKGLKTPLMVKKTGVHVWDKNSNADVPHHDLSLVSEDSTEFPILALSKDEALWYLRGETFPIEKHPKGIYLVTYENRGLGYIKHLGNRFNNLYPKEWRIRMQLG